MGDEYGLVVRFSLRPGCEAAFDQLVLETIAEIRQQEPETLLYSCHAVHGRPDQRIFYELYADRGAFEAHEEQPHVRRFLSEREPLLTRTDVDFLTPLDTAGSSRRRDQVTESPAVAIGQRIAGLRRQRGLSQRDSPPKSADPRAGSHK